jgi:hypothetical protein
MLTEVQYRNFDELIDSIKIDLRHFDLEGMIEPQQLIKVAIKANYELGLKVNPSRSKAIEIHKGKGRLPIDFYVLNFALLCEGHKADQDNLNKIKTYTEGILEGANLAQYFADLLASGSVRQYNATIDINPGLNIINHNLGTTDVIVQALATDGQMLSYILDVNNINTITIESPATVTITDVRLVVMGAKRPYAGESAEITATPNGNTMVHYNVHGKRHEYNVLIPMRIDKSKSVSADCFNLNSKDYHAAVIKNGFLVTNFDEGLVYINYQSLMEDDEGNLLVMDHPLVNEYYEYALKQRIYENLFMSGENVANYLQLVEQRLRSARNNALSFVNTPDFRELKEVWEMNRKAQYHNYYSMFKG